jgi:hypothetical protein
LLIISRKYVLDLGSRENYLIPDRDPQHWEKAVKYVTRCCRLSFEWKDMTGSERRMRTRHTSAPPNPAKENKI